MYKRQYRYDCVFCKKHRATLRYAVSKARVCNKCAKERLEKMFNDKQLTLFL